MKINRNVYLEKLIRRKKNGLIKVVTGIRRCGKSYLLTNIFHEHLLSMGVHEDHIIEIALDNIKYSHLLDPQVMYSYIENCIVDSEDYYIILDEVQLMDEFVSVLNGLLYIKNVDIYITGSNSKFLSRDIVTEFRGRGDEIHVLPLSFSEFCSVYKGTIEKAWDEYINYGGLPLVLAWDMPEEKEEYLLALFREVYLTDIIERHNIRNREELGELIDVLASSMGSLSSSLKLSRTFKTVKGKTISDITVSRYIEYLEDAFLINKAARYDVKGRKYIGSPAKYYFEDVGLRNARLNFRQTEENHIMENIIYNELRYRNFRVDVGVVECSTKTKAGTRQRKQYEVDFVASKGNLKYYIQSAFSISSLEKMEQEYHSLRNIPDSFTKIIVVREDRSPRRNDDGFITVGIHQFLLDNTLLS